jgi:ER membrane protein complex subunit 1
VASYGKVLGNRTTLYKWLNPRVGIVLTEPSTPLSAAVIPGGVPPTKASMETCGIYLVDMTKGSIAYRASVPTTSGGGCNVKATYTENWLVYAYYDPEWMGTGSSKGWRIVSVEIYEGKGVDGRAGR